jgi:hypothetical protein
MSADPIVLLAIDPSTRNLGWACCDLRKNDADIHDAENWKSGVIHPQGLEIHHKWTDAAELLAAEFTSPNWPTHMVVEWPMFFRSQRGRIAAQLDHTINLAGMAAGIIACFRFPPSRVTLLSPMRERECSKRGNAS